MDDREVIGAAIDHDGTPVSLVQTTHETPPIRGSDHTQFFSAESSAGSVGFLSVDDLARYLTSWDAETFDTFSFDGRPDQVTRTGLGIAPAYISFKPHAKPTTGRYGSDAEADDEAARTEPPTEDAPAGDSPAIALPAETPATDAAAQPTGGV